MKKLRERAEMLTPSCSKELYNMKLMCWAARDPAA